MQGISGVQAAFSTYGIKQSQNLQKDQMIAIISSGTKIQQGAANQKMVNQVNKASENMHIDIYG